VPDGDRDDDDDDDKPTARQIARKERRVAGDRTARVAATLMKLAPPALGKLTLDDDLRAELSRARAISSQSARRRAERTLAGSLRRLDDTELATIESALASSTSSPDTELFHDAERWRARLIEDDAALAEFGSDAELPPLIAKARAERDTGKPPGAARALFRHVMATLKARRNQT
jgi:ribosome-associated protein